MTRCECGKILRRPYMHFIDGVPVCRECELNHLSDMVLKADRIEEKFSQLSLDELNGIADGKIPDGITPDEIVFVAQGRYRSLRRSWMGICQQWVERHRPEEAVWKEFE